MEIQGNKKNNYLQKYNKKYNIHDMQSSPTKNRIWARYNTFVTWPEFSLRGFNSGTANVLTLSKNTALIFET